MRIFLCRFFQLLKWLCVCMCVCKERERQTEGERREGESCIFCLKESISGLSVSSLVLSCTSDTPSRVTCFNFKTVRFIYHLFGKPLKLDKNYSCEGSFTLSIVTFFLSWRFWRSWKILSKEKTFFNKKNFNVAEKLLSRQSICK